MKFNVFKGEDWLGVVTADSPEEAMRDALELNADATHVEERGEDAPKSGAQ